MTATDTDRLLKKLRAPSFEGGVGTCSNCVVYRELKAANKLKNEAADLIEELLKGKENEG